MLSCGACSIASYVSLKERSPDFARATTGLQDGSTTGLGEPRANPIDHPTVAPLPNRPGPPRRFVNVLRRTIRPPGDLLLRRWTPPSCRTPLRLIGAARTAMPPAERLGAMRYSLPSDAEPQLAMDGLEIED